MNEKDYGYRLLTQAIIRQAASDFEEASRYLTKSTTEEQLERVEINASGTVPADKQKQFYEEVHMRNVIKEVERFFNSPWCRALSTDAYSLNMFIETLKYRDWRRQCIRDGFTIPRGNEYVAYKDFTPEEKKKYEKYNEFHRDLIEIHKWYDSLPAYTRHQMMKVRSFDEDAVYRVLGIRFGK